MNARSVKLIATDLDGTLFGPDHEVSDVTAEALRSVAALGVEVVVATGRSHWSAIPRLEHLGCVRWLIGSNGATVYDFEAGDVVIRRPLGTDAVRAVVEGVGKQFPSVGYAWESPDGVFHSDRFVRNRKATDSRFPIVERPTYEFNIDGPEILKLMIAHDLLTEYDWLDAMAVHVPDGLSASTSGASFVEITAANANKGAALRLLCKQLGVDRAETIAFGDHSNDLAMLHWVGTGYAMANGAARLLEIADAVAPPNHEHGVAQVLTSLFLD